MQRGARAGRWYSIQRPMLAVSTEVAHLLLLFGLMIIPRVVQQLRIPAPLTSFGIGMAAALLLGASGQDAIVALMATLGISSLFLFAGLEIEPDDLQRSKWPLLGHLAMRALSFGAVALGVVHFFGMSWQVGVLLALAIFTPSTGFILDTLSSLDIDERERHWVRIKAVSGELFALIVLFVVLQSGSARGLALSSLALLAMVVGLPLLYLALGRWVIPYARGSEFSLLVMVGVASAYLTYKLGVYYLVGAFLAGFIARLLRERLPDLASDENLMAIQKFASFFVPFYFFYKGMGVPGGALTLQALGIGLVLTLVALPLRVGSVWVQRRILRGESSLASLRVAAALTPTLIFTLVIADILRQRYALSDALYGGLLVYAGLATMLPSLVMAKPVDFDLMRDTPLPAVPPRPH